MTTPTQAFSQGYEAARVGQQADPATFPAQSSDFKDGFSAGRIVNGRLAATPAPAPIKAVS